MERRKGYVLFAMLAAFLAVFPAAIRSQEAQPRLYLMGDFLVDTSRVGEYE